MCGTKHFAPPSPHAGPSSGSPRAGAPAPGKEYPSPGGHLRKTIVFRRTQKGEIVLLRRSPVKGDIPRPRPGRISGPYLARNIIRFVKARNGQAPDSRSARHRRLAIKIRCHLGERDPCFLVAPSFSQADHFPNQSRERLWPLQCIAQILLNHVPAHVRDHFQNAPTGRHSARWRVPSLERQVNPRPTDQIVSSAVERLRRCLRPASPSRETLYA